MERRGKFILSVLFTILPTIMFGSKDIILQDEVRNYLIIDAAYDIFYDSSGSYSFEKISDPKFPFFRENKGLPHVTTKDSSAYWIRMNIQNQASKNFIWYLELFDFKIDRFEIYIPTPKGFLIKKGGDDYPFNNKEINHKNFIYQLGVLPPQTQTYFIKIQSRKPVGIVGVIMQAEYLIDYSNSEYYLLALFYGIAIAMILYNFFLFITIRDFAYLYYVLFLVSMSFLAMCHDGTGFQFLWPNTPSLNDSILDTSLFSLSLWGFMYGKSFLNTAKNQPVQNKIIIILIIVRTIIYLLVMVKIIPPHTPVLYFDIASFAYLYIIGLLSWIKGFIAARYFVTAFSVLFTGFLITSLQDLGLVENSIWSVYAMNIGCTLQMFLLSMALADRVKILVKEKEEAQSKVIGQLKENEELKDKINSELENKVQERTMEINKMMEALENKNKELNDANVQWQLLNEKVSGMNNMLKHDNEKLTTDIIEISKSRILLQNVNLEEFKTVFPDEESCLKYLAHLKWKEGFKCKKCSYTKTTKSKFPQGMRCRSCNYDESPTTDTLFHNLKFPITKAFYMMHLVTLKDKKIKLNEISEILDLRLETCWRFRKKIMNARQIQIKKGDKIESEGWASLAMVSPEIK